jgi:hypothetical protein
MWGWKEINKILREGKMKSGEKRRRKNATMESKRVTQTAVGGRKIGQSRHARSGICAPLYKQKQNGK